MTDEGILQAYARIPPEARAVQRAFGNWLMTRKAAGKAFAFHRLEWTNPYDGSGAVDLDIPPAGAYLPFSTVGEAADLVLGLILFYED